MSKLVTVRLADRDIDQVLDGLRCRVAAWHHTAEYLETGRSTRSDVPIEECRDAEEAQKIAAHYARIIATIEAQAGTQMSSTPGVAGRGTSGLESH